MGNSASSFSTTNQTHEPSVSITAPKPQEIVLYIFFVDKDGRFLGSKVQNKTEMIYLVVKSADLEVNMIQNDADRMIKLVSESTVFKEQFKIGTLKKPKQPINDKCILRIDMQAVTSTSMFELVTLFASCVANLIGENSIPQFSIRCGMLYIVMPVHPFEMSPKMKPFYPVTLEESNKPPEDLTTLNINPFKVSEKDCDIFQGWWRAANGTSVEGVSKLVHGNLNNFTTAFIKQGGMEGVSTKLLALTDDEYKLVQEYKQKFEAMRTSIRDVSIMEQINPTHLLNIIKKALDETEEIAKKIEKFS